jgi:hypothetical protein
MDQISSPPLFLYNGIDNKMHEYNSFEGEMIRSYKLEITLEVVSEQLSRGVNQKAAAALIRDQDIGGAVALRSASTAVADRGGELGFERRQYDADARRHGSSA